MSYSKFTDILGILWYKQIYIHTVIPCLARFLGSQKIVLGEIRAVQICAMRNHASQGMT